MDAERGSFASGDFENKRLKTLPTEEERWDALGVSSFCDLGLTLVIAIFWEDGYG